jgi:prepilin-type N-terminal cleavage/methylation domain-containing protein
MTRVRLLRRRSLRSDDGVSLIEMLVTMVVFSILGVAMTLTVTSMARQSTHTNQLITATQQAQTTVDHMSRELRAADPQSTSTPATAFTYASATHLTLVSSLGASTGPSLVDLNIVNGNLQESITLADAGSSYTWTGTPTVKILATGVTGSTSLFTYYDSSGNVLAAPMTTATATSAIDHITITLVVQESDLTSPVTLSSTVYPRDLEYTS